MPKPRTGPVMMMAKLEGTRRRGDETVVRLRVKRSRRWPTGKVIDIHRKGTPPKGLVAGADYFVALPDETGLAGGTEPGDPGDVTYTSSFAGVLWWNIAHAPGIGGGPSGGPSGGPAGGPDGPGAPGGPSTPEDPDDPEDPNEPTGPTEPTGGDLPPRGSDEWNDIAGSFCDGFSTPSARSECRGLLLGEEDDTGETGSTGETGETGDTGTASGAEMPHTGDSGQFRW